MGDRTEVLALLFLGGVVSFVLGDPPRTIAGWWFPNDAAPWETVDAFFYPNSQDLSVFQAATGLDGVAKCREWVAFQASLINQEGQLGSDYECGLGKPYEMYGFKVYRAIVD